MIPAGRFLFAVFDVNSSASLSFKPKTEVFPLAFVPLNSIWACKSVMTREGAYRLAVSQHWDPQKRRPPNMNSARAV